MVLDFGAQYSRLIARRVRECRVYSEIVPYDIDPGDIKAKNPSGLILSGGPASVFSKNAFACQPDIFKLDIPILGICYGMQLMAQELGGKVSKTGVSEYGKTDLKTVKDSTLFKDLSGEMTVWMSHKDSVEKPPPGFEIIASTSATKVAAMENFKDKLFGVQFHPEVVHTPFGINILKNFLFHVCKAQPNWTMVSIIEKSVEQIKDKIGKGNAICALSGGVDSSVAALLVHKAIGNNLHCIFVDHGLLRKGEGLQVRKTFQENFHLNIDYVDAHERFIKKLEGVIDPEKKRKIIGEEFIRTFEGEAKKITDARYLVQGTLYPDVIESGTKEAARIKSHHNVGGLPEDIDFELIEPLRFLFKDEVRAVGEELGLPEEIIWRQPFPGPGLAVRIIGEVTKERLDILREADAIVTEEIKKAGLYKEIWQSFAILPDVRSVGVMGDKRTYAYPIVIRAVSSEDAMTADWVRLPFEILERISSRIINEVEKVNRVVYDISSKPPSTIEWE